MNWAVPNDIPLPLPAPFGVLVAALLISFALHIVFVNLMVGGSLLVVITEALGLRRRDWDRVSHAIAETLTVNKSVAVVLGVAPLLSLSVLYTMQLYTANALIGQAWLTIVPLVIVAFLLSYVHKYSWKALESNKSLHLTLAVMAALAYLSVPFIFLSTINLMIYPELWTRVSSFWSALVLPNVVPRYLHFLAACFAAVGLFLAWYLSRDRTFASLELETLTQAELRRAFLGVAFAATLAQLFFGPLLFMTLPSRAVSALLVGLLLLLVLPMAAGALWLLWGEVRDERPGRHYWAIVALLGAVVSVMVYARHDVRETSVAPHRAAMAVKTSAYMASVKAARAFVVVPGGLTGAKAGDAGETAFRQTCGSCHALDKRLVGPPLTEIASIYAGNPQGIVTWALNPGKKRPDYPQMPPQNLPASQLLEIANYMLKQR
jgi:cytochrome c